MQEVIAFYLTKSYRISKCVEKKKSQKPLTTKPDKQLKQPVFLPVVSLPAFFY